MDTIFVSSENSKKSNLYRLLFNRSDKMNLNRSDKYVEKYKKLFQNNDNLNNSNQNNLKHQLEREIKSWSYLMDYILYHIFKTFLRMLSKNK